ncbi:MAG: diguanylate cyclase [Acidobacteria bacterium]|nr:diguanylate cyclase [Acidobacteriota bacterium]
MIDRPVRVLFVDGQVEDSRWIQELIAEFEDSKFGGGWMHGIEMFHVERLAEALTLLDDAAAREQFDVVLLNPALPDSQGLHSFLRLQGNAPALPVVVLAELDDPDLAASMVRAGAQDFLSKSQLDAMPLARSLRLAVERNRIVRDLRAICWRDESTGLANRNGFDLQAEHDLKTAQRLGLSLAVLMIEMEGFDQLAHTYGKDEEQIAVIEAAELLRDSIDIPTTLARISKNRFAVSLLPVAVSEVNTLLTILSRRFLRLNSKANRWSIRPRYGLAWFHPSQKGAAATPGGGHLTIADLLAAAAQTLCENMGDTQPIRSEKDNDFAFNQLSDSTRRNL